MLTAFTFLNGQLDVHHPDLQRRRDCRVWVAVLAAERRPIVTREQASDITPARPDCRLRVIARPGWLDCELTGSRVQQCVALLPAPLRHWNPVVLPWLSGHARPTSTSKGPAQSTEARLLRGCGSLQQVRNAASRMCQIASNCDPPFASNNDPRWCATEPRPAARSPA